MPKERQVGVAAGSWDEKVDIRWLGRGGKVRN
jgi:hypothetical protein